MAEGVNVRFGGLLRSFIDHRIGPDGLYANTSEYIRDLVRRDFEIEEARRGAWLKAQLQPGMAAVESEFVDFDVEKIIGDAKSELTADGA